MNDGLSYLISNQTHTSLQQQSNIGPDIDCIDLGCVCAVPRLTSQQRTFQYKQQIIKWSYLLWNIVNNSLFKTILTLLSQDPAIRNIEGIVGGLKHRHEIESSGGLVTSKSRWPVAAVVVIPSVGVPVLPNAVVCPNVVVPPPNIVNVLGYLLNQLYPVDKHVNLLNLSSVTCNVIENLQLKIWIDQFDHWLHTEKYFPKTNKFIREDTKEDRLEFFQNIWEGIAPTYFFTRWICFMCIYAATTTTIYALLIHSLHSIFHASFYPKSWSPSVYIVVHSFS